MRIFEHAISLLTFKLNIFNSYRYLLDSVQRQENKVEMIEHVIIEKITFNIKTIHLILLKNVPSCIISKAFKYQFEFEPSYLIGSDFYIL